MFDHAPRLRAEQQQAADLAAIEDLERRSAPLQWAVILAVLVICLVQAAEQLHAHVERYIDLAAQEEALVQCLNGRMLRVGGAFVRCEVQEIQMVSMGEQP